MTIEMTLQEAFETGLLFSGALIAERRSPDHITRVELVRTEDGQFVPAHPEHIAIVTFIQ